jgi:phosphohistidine phosphatase
MSRSSSDSFRHLFVLRHGKAAAEPPRGGRDRDRELTSRGRADAHALGAAIARGGLGGQEGIPPPQQALCSSAVRTHQTARLVVDAMGGGLPLDAYPALYGADPDTLLTYVREIDPATQSALLVGHNPGVCELALHLLDPTDDNSDGPRRQLEDRGFPTCALAVLALPVREWTEIVPGSGRLIGVFTPPY